MSSGTCISIHAPTRGATRCLCCDNRCWLYFNPRSHKRSDTSTINYRSTCITFQSTLPQEERLGMEFVRQALKKISIHAPTRGATRVGRRYQPDMVISIHAPTRGATSEGCDEPPGWLYFNPRSHKRSDHCRADCCPRCRISIHAPTRGATCSYW